MSFRFDDLPRGWRAARFDEVLTRVERKIELNDSSAYDCACVRWYGLGAFKRETLFGMDIKRKQQWILRTGDIVYNKLFAWKSAFAIADEEVDGCIVSDKFPTYAADPSRLDTRYLGWYFRTPQLAHEAMSLSKGAAAISKLTLNPPQFWELTIPVPPLDEQRRIVARIEALAARIAEARGLRQAAIAEADELWKAGACALLNALPGSTKAPLRDVVTVQGGGTPSKSNPLFWAGDIPWVSPKDMKSHRIYDSHDHISEDAVSQSATSLLEPGCVLVVTRGMILAHTVPTAVLQTRAAINQDMKALFPRHGVTSEYLCDVLRALNFELLQLVDRSSHDTRKLETAKLLSFEIPVTDVNVQVDLSARFEDLRRSVDALHNSQSQSSTELDALLPALLDKAFRGEL